LKSMTPIYALNYFFCQFLFFRIAREVVNNKTHSWGVLFVLPMTGWSTNYKPTNPKYRRLFTTKAGKGVRNG